MVNNNNVTFQLSLKAMVRNVYGPRFTIDFPKEEENTRKKL
jgi:hypothetical protein